MTRIGATVFVRGEVSSNDDISVDGQVEGPVWCEGHAITVSANAIVTGDLVGRDITVEGRVSGTLLATEVVEIHTTAAVEGRIVATRLILHDGSTFHGEVQPNQVEAALTVARHRRR
jgi:cytoskeletal protein CcmA (bactofilin family)